MANMFGALNRFIARLDSDPNIAGSAGAASPRSNQQNNSNTSNHYGFQILRNLSSAIPLEPWFDFIIGINGHNIDNPDPSLFITEVRNCAPGSTISLGIYGAKGSQIREVYISVPQQGESLGLSLQWASLSVVEDVWHILDVMPNSPADVAGLLPYSDYVLGSPDSSGNDYLHGDAALGALVEKFLDRPLRLFVYNQEYDVTRTVTITPAKNWGGEGSLGCVLGYGALHRIPAPLNEPSTGPGETLFSSEQPSQQHHQQSYEQQPQTSTDSTTSPAEFLVPANMQYNGTSPAPSSGNTPTAPPPPGPGRARKARAHHNTAPTAGLDDYFAEGEQKSREVDNAPTPKNTGGLPPPPPKGGPPPNKASATVEGEKDEEA